MTALPVPSSTRLIQSTSAVSDGNGKITLTIGPAALSEVWEGQLTIPGAPTAAQWSAAVSNTSWGAWNGPANFGPVQLWQSESVVVTGTGLTPNTQYTMILNGTWQPESAVTQSKGPVAPQSVVSVETTSPLVNGRTISAGGGSVATSFQVPVTVRRLTIIFSIASFSSAVNVSLVGTTTGASYPLAPSSGQNVLPGNATTYLLFAAVEPAVDTTYNLTIQAQSGALGATVTVWVVAATSNPVVDTTLAPVEAIGGIGNQGQQLPVKVTGPVGAFGSTLIGLIAASTTNQVIIPAPGAGQSIYIQTILVMVTGSTAPGQITFAAGNNSFTTDFFSTILNTGTDKFAASYPGGFEVGNNTAVTVTTNAMGATCNVIVTYTTGFVT